MHIYLLKKENQATWAVLAKNEDDARAKLISYGENPGNEKFTGDFYEYSVKRFIDGHDGDIFNSLEGGVEIASRDHPEKRYFINAAVPTELV